MSHYGPDNRGMHPIVHGLDHALAAHLLAVAAGATQGAPAGAEAWAHLAGLRHDLGKFRPGFQRYQRLDENAHIEGRGVSQRAKSHPAAGARHALQTLKAHVSGPGRRATGLLAHLIAARHAGLHDAADLKGRLLGSGQADSDRELVKPSQPAPPTRPNFSRFPMRWMRARCPRHFPACVSAS